MAESNPVTVTVTNHRLGRIIAGSAMVLLGLVYRRWLIYAGLGLIFSDRQNRKALGSGARSVISMVSSRSKSKELPTDTE